MRPTIIFAALLSVASLSSWAIDPFTVELYQISCKICHGAGVAGAPKSFASEEWAERLKQGNDVLLKHAISGYKGMPPLGMCSDCSKEDLVDLIDYMSKEKIE